MSSTERKYEFTEETKIIDDVVLHRIQATKDFYIVDSRTSDDITEVPEVGILSESFTYKIIKKGTLGGWLEKEENLDQEGPCWVADEACVYGNASVRCAAVISGEAQVYDFVVVEGFVFIYGHAIVHGRVYARDHVQIYGYADVSIGHFYNNAKIYDHAQIVGGGSITVNRDVKIFGHAKMAIADPLEGSEVRIVNSRICRQAIIQVYAGSLLDVLNATIDYDINLCNVTLRLDEKNINAKPSLQVTY